MEYFFRHVADGEVSFNVAVVKLCLLFVILGVYRFRHSKWLLQVTFIGLLILQGLLMVGYLGTAFLPLSISGLHLTVCLLVEKRKIDSLFGLARDYWHDSSFQCARSFKIFMAPYYQCDLYWLPRILMVSGILVLAQIHSALKVKTVFAISTYMNGCLVGVNLVLHANYSYLMALPFDLGFRPSLPLIFGAMTLLMTATISCLAAWQIVRKLHVRQLRKHALEVE